MAYYQVFRLTLCHNVMVSKFGIQSQAVVCVDSTPKSGYTETCTDMTLAAVTPLLEL